MSDARIYIKSQSLMEGKLTEKTINLLKALVRDVMHIKTDAEPLLLKAHFELLEFKPE